VIELAATGQLGMAAAGQIRLAVVRGVRPPFRPPRCDRFHRVIVGPKARRGVPHVQRDTTILTRP
jgi:hypothetical protein